MNRIPFNKPYFSGNELAYIQEAIQTGKISGNGVFTQKCKDFFKAHYGFENCHLTSSCTNALEMAALLINVQPGDEVIVPSYTFVSTANAFAIRGAKIVFADSHSDYPGIDESTVEGLITKKTKAIVPVHYGGVACDMDKLLQICNKYNVFLIEDAAHAIDAFYTGSLGTKPLGSYGHMAAFSFHDTKNIISGEGGMLVVNDNRLFSRAEIIHEKGTNRSAFFRGEVDKYNWVDLGSSFLVSEITAAFLLSQLEFIDYIQGKRKSIWELYRQLLSIKNDYFCVPVLPNFASQNGHMFYLVLKKPEYRDSLIEFLAYHNIVAVFHYQSLHNSPFGLSHHGNGNDLNNSERYTHCLLRLPLYVELDVSSVHRICELIKSHFNV